MKTIILFLLLFVPSGLHWVKRKDSYRIHWLYVNPYGNEIGGYYQPFPNSWPATEQPKFTAQCYEGRPVEFATEAAAREFVLRCPVW